MTAPSVITYSFTEHRDPVNNQVTYDITVLLSDGETLTGTYTITDVDRLNFSHITLTESARISLYNGVAQAYKQRYNEHLLLQ